MKITTRPTPSKEICLANVYVWEWPVRITHWLNAMAIWVLSVTGLYMGRPFLVAPGEASEHFIMGWAKLIHFYAAIVFTLSVLTRIVWMFTGNKYSSWDKFIPFRRIRAKGLWPTIKYYLFAMRLPPGFVGHNPLAGGDLRPVVHCLLGPDLHRSGHVCGQRQCGLARPLHGRAVAAVWWPSDGALDPSRHHVAHLDVLCASCL